MSNFVWETENLPVADNTADVVKLRAGVVSSSDIRRIRTLGNPGR